jgi:YD repeat-containing protein
MACELSHFTTSLTYDHLNRLLYDTNTLGHWRAYGYDAVDNLTLIVDRNGRQRHFTHDNLDRLIAEDWLTNTGYSRTLTNTYDTGGRLTQSTDPAATYRYTYDAADQVVNVDTNGGSLQPLIAPAIYLLRFGSQLVQQRYSLLIDIFLIGLFCQFGSLLHICNRSWLITFKHTSSSPS